jgi:hypothetical protein
MQDSEREVCACGAPASPRMLSCAALLLGITISPPRTPGVIMSSSWSLPDWRWGYANGTAHDVAMRVRSALSTPQSRAGFLKSLRSPDSAPPLDEVKMVLALAWQRARNYGYDDADWEGAMEDMAACRFEGEGGSERLAQAIRARLGGGEAGSAVEALAAQSLDVLQFERRGL